MEAGSDGSAENRKGQYNTEIRSTKFLLTDLDTWALTRPQEEYTKSAERVILAGQNVRQEEVEQNVRQRNYSHGSC